jgi:hypothetical protein
LLWPTPCFAPRHKARCSAPRGKAHCCLSGAQGPMRPMHASAASSRHSPPPLAHAAPEHLCIHAAGPALLAPTSSASPARSGLGLTRGLGATSHQTACEVFFVKTDAVLCLLCRPLALPAWCTAVLPVHPSASPSPCNVLPTRALAGPPSFCTVLNHTALFLIYCCLICASAAAVLTRHALDCPACSSSGSSRWRKRVVCLAAAVLPAPAGVQVRGACLGLGVLQALQVGEDAGDRHPPQQRPEENQGRDLLQAGHQIRSDEIKVTTEQYQHSSRSDQHKMPTFKKANASASQSLSQARPGSSLVGQASHAISCQSTSGAA